MTLRAALPARPTGLTRGLWWLVLLALVVGTVLAAVGNVRSHGLAELAAVHPDAHSHLDAHDPSDIDTAADHAHHGDDHSHDKAHALPVTWHMAAPLLPEWIGQTRLWIEMVEASRLERPPMG